MKTDERRLQCSYPNLCSRLRERLNLFENHAAKGFVLVVATNSRTGAMRTVGVSFHTSAKDRGLLLNVCPFCGESLDWSELRPPVAVEEKFPWKQAFPRYVGTTALRLWDCPNSVRPMASPGSGAIEVVEAVLRYKALMRRVRLYEGR